MRLSGLSTDQNKKKFTGGTYSVTPVKTTKGVNDEKDIFIYIDSFIAFISFTNADFRCRLKSNKIKH